jgi:hypothetical protein
MKEEIYNVRTASWLQDVPARKPPSFEAIAAAEIWHFIKFVPFPFQPTLYVQNLFVFHSSSTYTKGETVKSLCERGKSSLLKYISLVPTDSNSYEPRLPSGTRRSKIHLSSSHSEYCVREWRETESSKVLILGSYVYECLQPN